MKKILYNLILIGGLFTIASCDLDRLLVDPNSVTVDTTNPDFLLNNIQVAFAGNFNGYSTAGMQVTRMINQPNNLYEQAYTAQFFDGSWNGSYATLLGNIKLMEQIGEDRGLTRHTGIARVIKAYTLMTLVDYFDAVPWSQALDPSEFNPAVDPAPQVYTAAFEALQQAKANFQNPFGNPNDFYFANNAQRWLRTIASLELKYHLSRRLIDEGGSRTAINALISAGNFPQPGDEFVFRYGTSVADPAARHPRTAGQLGQGGGPYQSTWYMFHLTDAKPMTDPRVRYYLYRQTLTNPTDPDELRCLGEIAPGHYLVGGWPFCLPGTRGYWGRDHLNAEGIPPDGLRKTLYGLYPGGGMFDDNRATPATNPSAGALGGGIQPIMLPAFVDFMLAESALTLGTTGDPKELLLSGIRKSMNYVRAFSLSTPESARITAFHPTAEWNEMVDNYVTFVDGEYGSAPANRRMHIIAREYWLALFGNGVEAYNLYRRTGQPDNMQPALINLSGGVFPRSFLYPNRYVVTNSSAQQRSDLSHRVFWDNNPPGAAWVY